MLNKLFVVVSAAGLMCGFAGMTLGDEEAAPQRLTVLDTKSFWRVRSVRETNEIVSDGKVMHGRVKLDNAWGYFTKEKPDASQVPPERTKVEPVEMVRLPEGVDPGWIKPDFDDSGWARIRGPLLKGQRDDQWKLLQMRASFELTAPPKDGDLVLSAEFRGGLVVYLNGEEIARHFIPKGAIDDFTPAEPYSPDAYFDPDGYAMSYRESRTYPERMALRERKTGDIRLPANKLRRGVNTIALAVHRAPALDRLYASRNRGGGDLHNDCLWARIGMYEVALTAAPGAQVNAATGALPGRGFKVWNQSIIQSISLADYPDPFAALAPLRLSGVRNGIFAGQIIVGDEASITNLKVVVSDLKGPAGSIPASAIRVRYAQPDGAGKRFDSLEDEPLKEIPVYKEHGGSVQPIWITVRTPGNAKPGEYGGSISIAADGVPPKTVPLKLKLFDWSLPAIKDYVSRMDLIQSPESVAMAYDVPLWSDEHFKLLDRTFAHLAELSCKTIFISCVRRTHFGNADAMVRWYRDDNDDLQPDFSIVEKYLDVATRHLGPIPGVILYCWEPIESQGHAGGTGSAARTYDRPALITVVDKETGKLYSRMGPAWGTPEAPAFWKRLTDGMQAILEKRGMKDSLLLGLIGDARPTKQAMDDISSNNPEARWAVHSHHYCDNWQGYKIGMAIALWGIGVSPVDPTRGYSFGWSNPFWLSYYPRELKLSSTLVEQRIKLERWMGAKRSYTPHISTGYGPRGLGRIGADFWPVVKDARGRIRGSLAGYYPESAWGQLNLNFCVPYLFGKGRSGAVATVRSEAFREGLQDVEARIYVEKALLDDEAAELLGEELLQRARAALDARIRMALSAEGEGEAWYISSGWAERDDLLFGLAAEIAAKYKGKAPNPNLDRKEAKK